MDWEEEGEGQAEEGLKTQEKSVGQFAAGGRKKEGGREERRKRGKRAGGGRSSHINSVVEGEYFCFYSGWCEGSVCGCGIRAQCWSGVSG